MAKTVGLGITGGIAAYKSAELLSQLKKENIEVIVMMTEAATKFVAPLTFETLSGREVITSLWQSSQEWKVQHIGIAEELDLLVIAPATANFIAKMAHGLADDLLSTVVLANTAPVLVVPAMNSNMFLNPVVQKNLNTLQEYGINIMQPEAGQLACGSSGPGRMPSAQDILAEIQRILFPQKDLLGKCLMVNAGTTCEDIDPVRFISNRGTGKMGYCIAQEAATRGAEVILVSGRTHLKPPTGVDLVSVWGAEEMCAEMLKYQARCDVIIGAAAVGDFRIAQVAAQKLKKTEQRSQKLVLELMGTPDILKELGKNKPEHQIMVGFAAETENVLENARKKLENKRLDFIVVNDVTMEGAGFAIDTNIVTIMNKDGSISPLPKMRKEEVAGAILDEVVKLL